MSTTTWVFPTDPAQIPTTPSLEREQRDRIAGDPSAVKAPPHRPELRVAVLTGRTPR